jgi:sphingomyelin phosphodiesterase
VYNRYINPDIICSSIDLCSSPVLRYSNFTAWAEDLLSDKPAAKPLVLSDEAPLNVAQLSDVHFDLLYVNGTNVDCGEPICCHTNSGPGKTVETTAGYWASYGCDIPERTMRAGIQSMGTRDVDFVLWTGDNPPHDLWNQT